MIDLYEVADKTAHLSNPVLRAKAMLEIRDEVYEDDEAYQRLSDAEIVDRNLVDSSFCLVLYNTLWPTDIISDIAPALGCDLEACQSRGEWLRETRDAIHSAVAAINAKNIVAYMDKLEDDARLRPKSLEELETTDNDE